MKLDFPLTINIASAILGFREMGAEVIPYKEIEEVYDIIEADDIVLDGLYQCNHFFKKFDKIPHLDDYPKILEEFLGRKIWTDTINNIAKDEAKWGAGNFVKPVINKVFTGKIIKSIEDLVGCGSYYEDYEVIVSESLDIKSEWRCFVLYDEIIDIRPYVDAFGEKSKSFNYPYDPKVVNAILKKFTEWEERPTACSIDICVTSDNKTLLMECNDAYALGCYGLQSILYAKMISARWSQILGVEDKFRF